jgi:hypothetical protein
METFWCGIRQLVPITTPLHNFIRHGNIMVGRGIRLLQLSGDSARDFYALEHYLEVKYKREHESSFIYIFLSISLDLGMAGNGLMGA